MGVTFPRMWGWATKDVSSTWLYKHKTVGFHSRLWVELIKFWKELDQKENWKISTWLRRSVDSNINFGQHSGRKCLYLSVSHFPSVRRLRLAVWVWVYTTLLRTAAAISNSNGKYIGKSAVLRSSFPFSTGLGTINSHLRIWGHSLSIPMSPSSWDSSYMCFPITISKQWLLEVILCFFLWQAHNNSRKWKQKPNKIQLLQQHT